MFTEIYSLMAIMFVPAMLFNHYFTMKTSNNLLMYMLIAVYVYAHWRFCYPVSKTILHVQQPVRVIKTSIYYELSCFKMFLILLALLLHPFLNIISYLFIMRGNGVGLGVPGNLSMWVKAWCVNPSQQPHSGSQIPAEDFTTLPAEIHGRGLRIKVGEDLSLIT